MKKEKGRNVCQKTYINDINLNEKKVKEKLKIKKEADGKRKLSI